MKAGEHMPQRKPSPLGLFWPNTVAECDTSFLEGSDIYTPSKLPYFKSTNDMVLIPSMNSGNYGSMSRQRANPNSCGRAGANSQNSNSRSGSTSPKMVQSPQPHMTLPSQCYLGGQSPIVLGFNTPGPTIVPVYNHTGSPDSSDAANE
jgi:hypothetical protein